MTSAPSPFHPLAPAPDVVLRPRGAWALLRRTIAVATSTLGLLVAFVASADAGGAGFTEGQHVEGLFYGDAELAIQLFAGSTAQDFCNGVEPSHDARVFEGADGSVDIMVDASAQPIYLYSSELGGPELIDATCQAMFDGDPETVPLEPFAIGQGQVRMRIEIAPDGTVHVVNSTIGTASAVDGTNWRVRGWADLMVVDGVPVGDPADFQGLRATMTGA